MNDCHDDDLNGSLGLSAPVRNSYFYGKLLDAHHLTLEQRYGNSKRWLLNRLTLGDGILCGLTLRAADNRLWIEPGAAIAPTGVEVIVPQTVSVDPRQLTDDCGRPTTTIDSGVVTICLVYRACPAEPAPVLVADCDTREGCAYGVIRESYAILVQEGAPEAWTPACAVDGLFVPADGRERAMIEEVVGKLVGVVGEACPDEKGSCVVLGQVTLRAGAAIEDADVTSVGRQMVASNRLLFELVLCLWDRVESCCSAASPPPPPLAEPLQVTGIEFLDREDQPVQAIADSAELPGLTIPQEIVRKIRFTFSLPVDLNSVTTAGPGEDGERFTVQVIWSESPANGRFMAGTIEQASAHSFDWVITDEPGVLLMGEWRVILFGNVTDGIHGAVTAMAANAAVRLDGETGIPSGDGAEGGNFELNFRVE